MDTVFKTYRAEVKDINEEDGSIDLFIPVSTDSVDRDGEIVEPLAFKKTLPKFMKRPVLIASHDYRDLTNQIGEWSKLKIEEGGLNGKPLYYVNAGNEQADWGFYLASKGMAAFSIGFIPKEWEDGDGQKTPRRTYKEVELLEISQVIVPSNREAIQSIRSKGVDSVTEKLLDDVENLVTKPEETDEYIRIPVDRGNHEGHRIRTINISEKEGIKAIYCGTDKVVMTYLFAKDKGWTMEKARAWVKEHGGKYFYSPFNKAFIEVVNSRGARLIIDENGDDISQTLPLAYLEHKKASQSEIIDEIDYLKTLIHKEGLGDDAKSSGETLLKQLLYHLNYKGWKHFTLNNGTIVEDGFDARRISGSDIPVEDIKPKKETLTSQDILESLKRIGGK